MTTFDEGEKRIALVLHCEQRVYSAGLSRIYNYSILSLGWNKCLLNIKAGLCQCFFQCGARVVHTPQETQNLTTELVIPRVERCAE
jgi:hypothetical protein